MKGRILDSVFLPEEGFCSVVKQTKYGTFYQEVNCHAEDIEMMNEWDGCAFAEYKCDLDALKAKIKHLKARLKGMQVAYSSLAQTVDTENEVMKKLYHQIIVAKKEICKMEAIHSRKSNNYVGLTDRILQERREFRKVHNL